MTLPKSFAALRYPPYLILYSTVSFTKLFHAHKFYLLIFALGIQFKVTQCKFKKYQLPYKFGLFMLKFFNQKEVYILRYSEIIEDL